MCGFMCGFDNQITVNLEILAAKIFSVSRIIDILANINLAIYRYTSTLQFAKVKFTQNIIALR